MINKTNSLGNLQSFEMERLPSRYDILFIYLKECSSASKRMDCISPYQRQLNLRFLNHIKLFKLFSKN